MRHFENQIEEREYVVHLRSPWQSVPGRQRNHRSSRYTLRSCIVMPLSWNTGIVNQVLQERRREQRRRERRGEEERRGKERRGKERSGGEEKRGEEGQ